MEKDGKEKSLPVKKIRTFSLFFFFPLFSGTEPWCTLPSKTFGMCHHRRMNGLLSTSDPRSPWPFRHWRPVHLTPLSIFYCQCGALVFVLVFFFSGSFHIFSHDWRLSIYSHCPQAYRSDGLSNRLNSTNQVLFFNTTIHFRWPLLHSPYWIRQRVEEFLRASPFQVNRYEDIHLISKKKERGIMMANFDTAGLYRRIIIL